MEPEDVKMVRAYLRMRDDDSPYLFISNRMLPIHRQTLWDMMQRYGRKAGLPKAKRKFHALRHSIAVHMLDGQADIAFVRDRLGHKNIQNTMVYARYSTVAREEQTRRVFASHRVV
jgi:type 1 fimbriae regulatory protein FimB